MSRPAKGADRVNNPEGTPVPLSPERLAWTCPPEWLSFSTIEDVTAAEEVTPQREAVAALRLGLKIRARGYNVFVAGLSGTGRTSTVRRIVNEECTQGAVPDDLLFVNNLEDPRSPTLLRLPAGKGRIFRDSMAQAADRFRQGLSGLRASGAHRRRRETVARCFREQHSELVASFQEEVAKEGFTLIEVSIGPIKRHDIAPVIDGRPVPVEELLSLVHEEKLDPGQVEALRQQHSELTARLSGTTSKLKALNRQLDEALAEADREAARPLVDATLEEIRGAVALEVGARPEFDAFLEQLEEFLLEIFPMLFAASESLPQEGGEEDLGGDPLDALKVNLLVDRSSQSGRPFVVEGNPTPARLLGYLEVQRGPEGMARADVLGIRPGSLHAADGGFLLINAQDLVSEEGAWPALRRVLRTGKMSILAGNPSEGPPLLMPEETPIDVTVILVGNPALREMMAQGDDEFSKLFKVTAVLEERIDITQEAVASYLAYLKRLTAEEHLSIFRSAAVGRLLEAMVRLAGHRSKISTRFRLLTDLARESSWHAKEAGADRVDLVHVEAAIEARRGRQGILSARIGESMRDGTLKLDLEGATIGQVNALAVVETGLERFGYPARVTATTAVGRSGIIDIEREAELSGEIHTKASLILAGYLRSLFAQKYPLAVTASICFEQSYGGVEGDSASSAELAALLSSLARRPFRQNLAITGAVDQKGNILAVGGVNEKVEGFWRICRERGLTGDQGVLLPAASVNSLQLEPALVEDVRQGRFSIYGVSRVEEMISLLAGVPLGTPDLEGNWPSGTLGEEIARRLEEMARVLSASGNAFQG